jgi:hypothetical protein
MRPESANRSTPGQENTDMEYSHRYPCRYVACVLLLFALMLRAGMTVAATEAALTGYKIEGISAAMTLDEIRSQLEASGYAYQEQDWATGARMFFTMKDKDNVRKSLTVKSRNGNRWLNIAVDIQLPKNMNFDPEAEGQKILAELGQAQVPCTAKKRLWACKFGTGDDPQTASLKAAVSQKSKKFQITLDRDAGRKQQELAQQRSAAGIDCFATADPESYDQVYNCMAGYRYTTGVGSDMNRFVNNIGTSSCRSIQVRYTAALKEAGIVDYPEIANRTPSCEILARVSEEMTGKPAYWSGCLGYPGPSLSGHVERCLSTSLVAGGAQQAAGLARYRNCPQVIQEYERLLGASTTSGRLPEDYTTPECAEINTLVAKWTGQDTESIAACTGYDPANQQAHLEACLALPDQQLIFLRDCLQVRQMYEQKLAGANGRLPPGYSMLPCSATEGILARAEKARQEYAVKAAAARRLQLEARARQMEENNRVWQENMDEVQRIAKLWDVGTGPVVPLEEFSEKDRSAFRSFEQPGILLALLQGRMDLLEPRRNAVIIYLASFQDALTSDAVLDEDSQCYDLQDIDVHHEIDEHMMKNMGMEKFMSTDPDESASFTAALGVAFFSRIFSGEIYSMAQQIDDVKRLQEKGWKDTYRLAKYFQCDSSEMQQIYGNIQKFVLSSS